jgi:hypothetical protein
MLFVLDHKILHILNQSIPNRIKVLGEPTRHESIENTTYPKNELPDVAHKQTDYYSGDTGS